MKIPRKPCRFRGALLFIFNRFGLVPFEKNKFAVFRFAEIFFADRHLALEYLLRELIFYFPLNDALERSCAVDGVKARVRRLFYRLFVEGQNYAELPHAPRECLEQPARYLRYIAFFERVKDRYIIDAV